MTEFKIGLAAHYIRQGGIIAYPTEAVYGLGCDPFNGEAVLRLLSLKQRSWEKGLIIIASDTTQIAPFIAPLSASHQSRLQQSWPGPTTWLIPANPHLPRWITGKFHQIALRVTAHPVANALCKAVGHAIISTSANISQQPPAKSALRVRQYFDDQLDYILSGPLGSLQKPTTIKDLVTDQTIRA